MKLRATIGLALVGAVGVSAVLLRSWPLINVVETGRTPEYPDITPRVYREKTSEVFDAALHAVSRLPRWSLVRSAEEKGELSAEASTRVLGFIDDVIIRVSTRGQDTVVDVRSASRVGRGDFGQNARNIRAFLEELDRQMQGRSIH
jgi:uncharacterized protein (DUF1499 family)